MIDDEQIAQAFDRVARTADGETIYRFFQKKLMGTLADLSPDDSALRSEHGMRRFAAEVMAMMAKGIDERGGRTSSTGDRATERTVVFRRGEPARGNQRATPREYIRANDPELKPFLVNDGSGS